MRIILLYARASVYKRYSRNKYKQIPSAIRLYNAPLSPHPEPPSANRPGPRDRRFPKRHGSLYNYPPSLLVCSALLKIHASKLSLTHFLTLFLKTCGSSLHCFAASTFAGLSSLGLLSIDITLISIVSGVCTGNHLSAALS